MRYNGEKCLADTNSNGSGVTCPGAPRSVYSGIPWGTVDIDDAYTRPLFIDISNSPYANWKVASGPVNIRDLQLPSLPLALMRTQHNDTLPISSILKGDTNPVLNPYLGRPGSYPTTSLSEVLLMT